MLKIGVVARMPDIFVLLPAQDSFTTPIKFRCLVFYYFE